MAAHLISKQLFLSLISVLEKLLNNVVTEDVRHQLASVRLKLPEDLVFFVTIGGLELLLDESRSVLVTTELYNVVINVLIKVSTVV